MAVATLLALDMLAITPGMIAGSALTDARQVPNVVTQVSAAYCSYIAATGGSFLGCMREFWIPTGTILGTAAAIGVARIKAGEILGSWRLIKTGLRFLQFSAEGCCGVKSISSTIKKIILFLMVLGYIPFSLLFLPIIILIHKGFFDFLYGWSLVLIYSFFLYLTVLIHEFSNILRMFIFSFIFEKRRCTRRFLRLVCIFEAPKAGLEGLGGTAFFSIFFTPVAIWRPETYRHEMQHVKDGVVASLLISVGVSVFPFVVLVLKGIKDDVYPPDAFPLSIALFPWAILWFLLVWLLFEFRAYRYADGLSFKETLQKLTLYADEKKFGNTVFQFAISTLAVYWGLNVAIVFENSLVSFYHFIVVFAVAMATPVVLAVVVGWALDVFTRRLFGEALGKFLFATFVVGALFHPLLGLLSTFLYSWAMFGKASDAAAATAITALSLFAVMLPGLVWMSALLL